MKKLLSSIYVLTIFLGFFSVSQGSVFALDAYLSANKLSINGDVYTDGGLVGVADNAIFGWRLYLPAGFSCGDKVVVDNPDSPGMALRDTTASTGVANNVIPGCSTVASGETELTVKNVSSSSDCTIASGIWTGSVCSFDGSGFQLPLQAGRCYSLSGGSYSVITCPPAAQTTLGSNCAVANTPPIPGFYTIDCTTGRTIVIDQNGDAVCAGVSDTSCMQTDGRYRCWDGSTIAPARGVTCPIDPNSVNASLCENSGGVWDATNTICSCPSPLGLNGNTCVDPNANPDTAGTTTTINTDCDEKPLTRENCGIINLLVGGINFLSALAGIVFVFSIMISGFQYMTARDNAGQIEKAKHRIVMTFIALAIYIFMYALLNFLVPGGVL